MFVLAHACARVRAHAGVRDVFEIYDNKYLTQADNDNNLLSYISYTSDTLMISPQRVYRLVLINRRN